MKVRVKVRKRAKSGYIPPNFDDCEHVKAVVRKGCSVIGRFEGLNIDID